MKNCHIVSFIVLLHTTFTYLVSFYFSFYIKNKNIESLFAKGR